MPAKAKKSVQPSGQQQVADFLDKLEHPLKKEIEAVRTIILSANGQLTEHIKWNAPSFCIGNEDRITFNLQGKGFFRLVFHCGAKVKEQAKNERLFEDDTGLLDWVTNDRATVKLIDWNDVEQKQEQLAAVVNKWIEATSS